jgi:hypothetical protein
MMMMSQERARRRGMLALQFKRRFLYLMLHPLASWLRPLRYNLIVIVMIVIVMMMNPLRKN